MEAGAEGAFGLSEAREGSPVSGATASDDGDTVVGVSYGVDSGDTGTSLLQSIVYAILSWYFCISIHSVTHISSMILFVGQKYRIISASMLVAC